MTEAKSNGRFQKGESGNPAGRKPEDKNRVRDLARAHTEKSIETLASILANSKNDMARLRAAEALLARGWGQPVAHIETTSSLAEEIDRIKRRSVGPLSGLPVVSPVADDGTLSA